MSKKSMGIVLIVVGVLLAIVSLTADLIGIGGGGGIGWKQLLGAAIGLIVAVGGAWLMLSKPGQKK